MKTRSELIEIMAKAIKGKILNPRYVNTDYIECVIKECEAQILAQAAYSAIRDYVEVK